MIADRLSEKIHQPLTIRTRSCAKRQNAQLAQLYLCNATLFHTLFHWTVEKQ